MVDGIGVNKEGERMSKVTFRNITAFSSFCESVLICAIHEKTRVEKGFSAEAFVTRPSPFWPLQVPSAQERERERESASPRHGRLFTTPNSSRRKLFRGKEER